jgi:2-polyprenyl-3-methyl-5-hydroxy-6-metoxy-1,4-benzoquinol methylase
MQARPTTCNACGADRFVAESQVDGWNIGHCADCGLVFVNPIPFFDPTDEFSEISKGFEYTEYMHGPLTDRILEFERRQFQENAAEVERLTSGVVGTGSRKRFLDIGCGSGASVRAATDLGWQAIGIDLDPQLVAHGRKELGVDLRSTSVLDSNLPAGSFDFIKLRDVAEHLPNPLEVFTRIKELLAADGVLLLITPNEGGIATKARLVMRRPRKLVATVPPPHHLHSFTPKTLARTLRRAGLKPGKTFTTSPTDWRYVTSHNMARAQSHPLFRPIWGTGTAVGMGAVLVSWVRPS